MVPTAYAAEAILCLVSVVLCLLTGSILLLSSARNKCNLFLGLSYVSFAMGFLVISLIYSRWILYVPHLYRTGQPFLLLYMPLSWLYVRSSIRQKPLSAWDLLHLLPVVLYIVDYFPFLISSSAYKVAAIDADLGDLTRVVSFRLGWLFPPNTQVPIRTVQMAFYWILQVRLLASADTAPLRKDPLWLRWQYIYNALQLPIFLPALIALFTGSRDIIWATSIPPAAAILLSTLTLFAAPRILYGTNFHLPPGRIKVTPDKSLTKQLSRQLEQLMQEKKPFLDPDYSLRDLADATGIPLHKLSFHINQDTGTNFSEYLNRWRIRYCLELIEEKKTLNLNLHGIATKCGFNNRNTFSSAFKKFTGKTPSTYLHSAN